MRHQLASLTANLSQTIIGKQEAIQLMLVALLSGGHALLEDVPGVGKTLLAKTLARSIAGKFQRVQATPDLLPSDVTGTNIWNPQSGQFEFLAGPVFSHVLLVDEINRATPRTQSALLEVMEEQQVTIDGFSRPVPHPFFVIATQNPVEYQGTFPLPEAQMDRFALAFSLGYPTEEEEIQMLRQPRGTEVQPCLTVEDILELQRQCAQVSIPPDVQTYAVRLVRSTRTDERILLGVSPRGSVALQRACQARAFLEGRDHVLPDDVKVLVPPVLTHRLVPAPGQQATKILAELLHDPVQGVPNSSSHGYVHEPLP